jgi:uncharacterized protein (DUF1919 family)
MFFMAKDFMKFCQNLEYYLSCEIKPVAQDEYDYPVASIDDILLYCMHFNSFDEVREMGKKEKE